MTPRKPTRLEAPMRYRHAAVVRINAGAEFPWDMLRYERAWITTESDVAIALASEHRRDVRIERHSYDKEAPWTAARWESFGVTFILP